MVAFSVFVALSVIAVAAESTGEPEVQSAGNCILQKAKTSHGTSASAAAESTGELDVQSAGNSMMQKVDVCTNIEGAISSTYPCKCGATTAATTQCSNGEVCTASTDTDGVCEVRLSVTISSTVNITLQVPPAPAPVQEGPQYLMVEETQCPSGYTKVTEPTGCEEASLELGLVYNGPLQGAGSQSYFPWGCFQYYNYYFASGLESWESSAFQVYFNPQHGAANSNTKPICQQE